ncbi:MAG: UvrD-helicase domain-containing protein [Deinococcales bacterium]
MTTEHSLLSALNSEQQEAVKHFQGPALVLAGAGSGKTRTVVHRIAYLMEHYEVYPSEILAVTFTNKAAGELKSRVADLMGEKAKDLWVSTFHAACLRILRSYGGFIGLNPGFVIYDDSDQHDVLKGILKNITSLEETNPRHVAKVIDRAKSQALAPAGFLEAERANGTEKLYGQPLTLWQSL